MPRPDFDIIAGKKKTEDQEICIFGDSDSVTQWNGIVGELESEFDR